MTFFSFPGTVTTFYRWGIYKSKNWIGLHRVSSGFCLPKTFQIGSLLTALFKKKIGWSFLRHGVVVKVHSLRLGGVRQMSDQTERVVSTFAGCWCPGATRTVHEPAASAAVHDTTPSQRRADCFWVKCQRGTYDLRAVPVIYHFS